MGGADERPFNSCSVSIRVLSHQKERKRRQSMRRSRSRDLEYRKSLIDGIRPPRPGAFSPKWTVILASLQHICFKRTQSSAIDRDRLYTLKGPCGTLSRVASKKKLLKILGGEIRMRRLDRGWNQDDLAEKAGFHRTFVSAVERGVTNVAFLDVDALARALDSTLTEIVSEVERRRR